MKHKKINIKPKKNLPEDLGENAFLQVGVILEDLSSKFKVFGDGLAMNNYKLDIVIKEVGIIKEEIILMKMDIAELKEDVSVLKKDVSVLKKEMVTANARQDRMELDIKAIKVELYSIKSELEKLKLLWTQKPDLDKFLDLEKRVLKIEEVIQNH